MKPKGERKGLDSSMNETEKMYDDVKHVLGGRLKRIMYKLNEQNMNNYMTKD